MEYDSCNACLLELSQTSKNFGRKGNEWKKNCSKVISRRFLSEEVEKAGQIDQVFP